MATVVRQRFPLNGSGLLLTAAALLAGWHYGLQHRDIPLAVAAIAALVTVALCLLFTGLGVWWLSVRMRHAHGSRTWRVICGVEHRTEFELPRPWLIPFLRLGWAWPYPPADLRLVPRGTRLTERVRVSRRGDLSELTRWVTLGDVFGFTGVTWPITWSGRFVHLPHTGALRAVDVARTLSAGDDMSHPEGPPEGDRVDFRQYAPGDPMRLVLWKVFARSRELMVRTPERALGPSRRVALYFMTGEQDEAAAGVTRFMLESGALGTDWVFGIDTQPTTTRSLVRATGWVCGSGNARTSEPQGGSLSRYVQDESVGGLSRVVVVAPGVAGPWVDRLRACLHGPGSPMMDVWLCGDRGPQGRSLELIEACSTPRSQVRWVDRSAGTIVDGPRLRHGVEQNRRVQGGEAAA